MLEGRDLLARLPVILAMNQANIASRSGVSCYS
jgi:hypothetical protein